MRVLLSDLRHRRLGVCSALLALTVMAGGACPGDTGGVRRNDAGSSGQTISVQGLVVDFESCFTGCQGVSGLRVSLFFDPSVVSEPTGSSGGVGAYRLAGVPNGARSYLLVSDPSGQYVSTLQAGAVVARGADQFNVMLFALSRDKAFYRSVGDELSASVEKDGLYVGQLEADDGSAYGKGATATVAPETTIRYVKTNLDLDKEAKEAFFPKDYTSTGIFGQFVVLSPPDPRDLAVLVDASSVTFTPTFAPVGAGYVTIGVHRAMSKTPEK